LDPKLNAGTLQRDETPVEFGGNTPSGGKFAEPWDWHGWMADPAHRTDTFKRKTQTYYGSEEEDDDKNARRKARIQKEVAKCTPPDEEDE
jgi:hypothetical protein